MKKHIIAPKMQANTHCFVCFKKLKNINSVRVGEESLCETCHSDYWSWVMRGMALMPYRGASLRTNKHLADICNPKRRKTNG